MVHTQATLPVHKLYGLRFRTSIPLPLSQFSTREGSGFDLEFSFDRVESEIVTEANWQALVPETRHFLAWRSGDHRFFKRCFYHKAHPVSAILSHCGSQVWVLKDHQAPQEDVLALLLGPIFGTVLRLKGKMCLHASCVASDSRATAIMGESGQGKSTLAAFLCSAGMELVSDDLVCLTRSRGGYLAESGYGSLRLDEATFSELGLDFQEAPEVLLGGRKRYWKIRDHLFLTKATPVPVVLSLEEGSGSESLPRKLSQSESLIRLSRHIFARSYPHPEGQTREFEFLAQLSKTLDMYTVSPPRSLAQLRSYAKRLRIWFERLACDN